MCAPFRQTLITLAFLLLVLTPQLAGASIILPKGLTQSDREEVLRVVGFGMSGKILSDPYPLGGYLGLEFGVSVENLPTEDIGRLGSGISPQKDVAYPKLSIGKGFYNNIDLFLNFTPYNHQDEMSHYGGIVRWGFYQSNLLPFNASVLAHYNSANINNQLTMRSYGFDVVGGVNVRNVSLFAGAGLVEANGLFMGGIGKGITDSNRIENEVIGGFHTLIGASLHLSNFFVSVQMDRYQLPIFSGKIGVRL